MTKTNAMRMLDAAKIPYRVLEYEVDESDLSGIHIAETLGFPPEKMFKTLVAKGDRTGALVFCVPVAAEIDLRRAASITGNKKIEMIHVKDLLALTGYIRGGVSPIGMKKKFRTFIDEQIILHEKVCISGGQRGVQIKIAPDDLIKATEATVCDLCL